MSFAPGCLGYGHGLAGHHGFVEGGSPFQQHAVDGDLFAGPDPQAIPDIDGVERDLFVAAVGANPAGGLRREIEQRLDGAGGLLARAQLQDLAEQHQNGDDRGRLEIDGDGAIGAAECGRKHVGRHGCNHAVEPSHARAHRNQREHVEVATDQRLPSAHEEWPARPQHHGRRQHQLDPVGSRRSQQHVQVGEMPAHFQRHHGHGEREADPQAARHIDKLGIGAAPGRRLDRLQRHAADRAAAGTGLPDLGMHRTSVDRPGRQLRGGSGLLAEILCGIGRKLGSAAGGAEVIGAVLMIVTVLRLMRIDRHAADGVFHPVAPGGLCRVPVFRAVGGMRGMFALRSNIHRAARCLMD